MKVAKVNVNRTPEKPEGVEIEIVQPQTDLETRVVAHLLANAVKEAKRLKRIEYKLPETYSIEHKGEGTYVIVGTPPPKDTAAPVAGGGYYQPPRPLAIVGLRTMGKGFDMIHAEITPEAVKKASEAVKKGEGAEVKTEK